MSIKDQLKKCLSDSTMHGLPLLYNARHCGRAFWVVITLVGCCMAAYQSSKLIQSFLNEDIGTTTTAHNTPEMPDVYICPLDWLYYGRSVPSETFLHALNGFLPIVSMEALMVKASLDLSFDIEAYMLPATEADIKMAEDGVKLHGGSLAKYINSVRARDMSWAAFTVPSMSSMKEEPSINWNGVCSVYKTNTSTNLLSSKLAVIEIQHFSSRVNDSAFHDYKYEDGEDDFLFPNTTIDGISKFRLALAKPGEKQVLFPFSETLDYGHSYSVKYKVIDKKRVSRKGAKCNKDWTLGDMYNCIASLGNAMCEKTNSCVTYIPETKSYKEQSDSNLCNTGKMLLLSSCIVKSLTVPTYEINQVRALCSVSLVMYGRSCPSFCYGLPTTCG